MIMSWGTLCPEELPSERRQQDLDLAAAVRYFNDRAVPGLGGLWFPMPLVWSILAVALKERLKKPSALPIGNAVEALVMSRAIKSGVSDHGGRIRGSQKLQSLTDTSFKNLTRPGVYMVQPTRMAMVQPLVELGFVTGSRYGAFELADSGREMLTLMNQSYEDLEFWAKGISRPSSQKDLEETLQKLSPTAVLPKPVGKLIKSRILYGKGISDEGAKRRRALIELEHGLSREDLRLRKPPGHITENHWIDLQAGAAFMDLRDDALAVLSAIENALKSKKKNNESKIFLKLSEASQIAKESLIRLKKNLTEKNFLPLIEKAGDCASKLFAEECSGSKDIELIKRLVQRDGSVIAWHTDKEVLIPGPAWDASDSANNRGPAASVLIGEKANFAPQLFRLWNLHCLMSELNGNHNPRSPKLN